MAHQVIPSGWSSCTLSEIVDVNPKKIDAEPDLIAGFVPMASAPVDFQGSLQFEEKKWGEIKKSYTNFKDNDVIFAKVTPCFENGKAAIVRNLPNGIGAGSSEFYVLRPHTPYISEKYVFSIIKSQQFMQEGAENMTGAVGLRRVPRAFVENYSIPLPPLAEQKVIADKLDSLLAQVETTKTRLDRIPDILKRFRQSVLAAAVSGRLTEEWREDNHKEIISAKTILELHKKKWLADKKVELIQKGKLPINDTWKKKYKEPESVEELKIWKTPNTWAWTTIDTVSLVTKLAGFEYTKLVDYSNDGSIPVIKAQNIGKEGFKNTTFSEVSTETVNALPRSELFGGETLIVFVGAGVGQVGSVPLDQKYFLGPNVAVVRDHLGLYSGKYLELLIRSLLGQQNLLSFSKGAAQPSLSMGQIRQTSIPIPPLNEQSAIVRRIEELFAFAEAVEQKAQAATDRVNKLTQSILAKAFRGDLTKDWRAANPDLISGENSAKALLEKIKAEREAMKPKKKTRAKKVKA